MVELKPVQTGQMEACPTGMGERLRDMIPQIETALRDADGENPYALYSVDDIKTALGSKAKNPHGLVACINRLLDDQFGENSEHPTRIVAHNAVDRILFNYHREALERKVI